MALKLSGDDQARAVASIERYFREQMDEPIGNVVARDVLGFFLQVIAPSIYNQAVVDVQARMRVRVSELDIEVHETEFAFWHQRDRRGKAAS